MLIEPTTRYHLTVVSPRFTNNKSWRNRAENRTLLHFYSECKFLTAYIQNATEVAWRTKIRVTVPSCNPTPRCTYGGTHRSKDTCTPMSPWHYLQQSRYASVQNVHPLTNRSCKSATYIRWTTVHGHKREWNHAIGSDLNGCGDDHTKSDRERQTILWYHL